MPILPWKALNTCTILPCFTQALALSIYQVAVVVGGIAEMFMVSKNTETLYLKKRKNFTKIAVEVRRGGPIKSGRVSFIVEERVSRKRARW